MPLDYLEDPDLIGNLKAALGSAEKFASCLRGAVWSLVAAVLAPDQELADTDRVRAMVKSLAPERWYWSRLEIPFRAFLAELPGDQAHRQHEVGEWFSILDRTAKQAFDNCIQQFDTSSRVMRAAAIASQKLSRDLSPLLQSFKEYGDALATNR